MLLHSGVYVMLISFYFSCTIFIQKPDDDHNWDRNM